MSAEQFDFVPSLRDLLSNGGLPGLEYAQVCTHHLLRAQTEEEPWLMVNRAAYQITGPKGAADMVLMVRGKEIRTANTSGARRCSVDTDVEVLTGHSLERKDAEKVESKDQVEATGPVPAKQGKPPVKGTEGQAQAGAS
jgi:hypothetical protein